MGRPSAFAFPAAPPWPPSKPRLWPTLWSGDNLQYLLRRVEKEIRELNCDLPETSTGFVVGILFPELNGYRFTASEESATLAVLELAAGTLDEHGYTAFLRANVTPA